MLNTLRKTWKVFFIQIHFTPWMNISTTMIIKILVELVSIDLVNKHIILFMKLNSGLLFYGM